MDWIQLAQDMVQYLVQDIVVMDHKTVSIFTIWRNIFHPKDCPITLTSSKIKFSALKTEKKEMKSNFTNIWQSSFNDKCWLRAYWGVTGGHSRTGDPDTRAQPCTNSVHKFLAQSILSHQKDEARTAQSLATQQNTQVKNLLNFHVSVRRGKGRRTREIVFLH